MRFLRYKALKSVMGSGRAGPGREFSDFSLKYERTRSARCARSLVTTDYDQAQTFVISNDTWGYALAGYNQGLRHEVLIGGGGDGFIGTETHLPPKFS